MGKYLSKVDCDGRGLVMIVGKFEGSETAATVDSQVGVGFATVTAAGSGVYTVTFNDSYNDLVSFVASPSAVAPGDADTYVFGADEDSWTTADRALAITASEGGTPTDLDAEEYCNFIAVFRNTTLTEMLRLAPKPQPGKNNKPAAPSGTSTEDLDIAIKEFDKNRNAKSLKAMLTLAAEYSEGDE